MHYVLGVDNYLLIITLCNRFRQLVLHFPVLFLWSRIFRSCIFTPCNLVLHFQVLHFHVIDRFWSSIFRSCIFSQPVSVLVVAGDVCGGMCVWGVVCGRMSRCVCTGDQNDFKLGTVVVLCGSLLILGAQWLWLWLGLR